MNQPPAVAGIDPSMTDTGLAVDNLIIGEPPVLLRSKTKAPAKLPGAGKKDQPPWSSRIERLNDIVHGAIDPIPYRALVVMEGPSYGSTGSVSHDIAGTWWAIARGLRNTRGATLLICPPATLKMYATGSGNAAKGEVLAAVIKAHPELDISNDNVADAVTLWAIGRRLLGMPVDRDPSVKSARAIAQLQPEFDRLFHAIA